MKTEAWAEMEIDGPKRRHIIRLDFVFSIGGDGDPGLVHITSGAAIMERDGKTIRERGLSDKIVEKLRGNRELESFLFENTLQELPHA